MQTTGWSQETKDEALRLYQLHGPTVAAEMLGIPVGTVKRWSHVAGLTNAADAQRWDRERLARQGRLTADENEAHQAEHQEWLTAADIRQERKRAELRERWLDVALEALDRTEQPHIDYKGKDAQEVVYPRPGAGDYFNYVKSAATALDKYRLEVGESTDRTEVIGDSPVDREIQRLLAEHERQAQARAQDEAVAGDTSARTDTTRRP